MLLGVEWPGDCECGNRNSTERFLSFLLRDSGKVCGLSRMQIMTGRPHDFVPAAVITVLSMYRRHVGSNEMKELSGGPWKKASLSGHSSEQNDGI